MTMPDVAAVGDSGHVTDHNLIRAEVLRLEADKLDTADATATYLALAAAQSALVITAESTSSSAAVDLATVGPSVTVTIGSSGRALVVLTSQISSDTVDSGGYMGVEISGASTVSASNLIALRLVSNTAGVGPRASHVHMHTGLTAGSNTFTAKYGRLTSGTATFVFRYLVVIPL